MGDCDFVLETQEGRYGWPPPWWIPRVERAPAAPLARAPTRNDQAAFVAHCRAFIRQRFGMTRRELYDLVWLIPVERAAARFGMSGNALRKTCRRYQIPVPGVGYWRNLDARRPSKLFRRPSLRPLVAPRRQQARWGR